MQIFVEYFYLCVLIFFMKKIKTKDRLLLEAYKLFASKPYDQVTFADLEKATKLSRGAILYHIQNKENLFRMVLDKYMFDPVSSQHILQHNPKIGLWDFILLFLESLKKMKEEMRSIGIKNMNLAIFNIECAAIYCFPDLKQAMKEWMNNEIEIRKQVLNNALANKEIKENTDIPLMATLLEHLSLGNCHHGTTLSKGEDLKILKKELRALYDMIKAR